MGFSSVDDLINEITTNGKIFRSIFQKTHTAAATSAAGRVHEFFTATGIPSPGGFSGTAGIATVCNSSTAGALNLNGATVTPDTRHIINAGAVTSSATIAPAQLMLVDLLLYYPSLVVTGTATTLDNTATLTRYTNGNGVMLVTFVQTVLGAAAPALTYTYTDNSGNTGNTSVLTSPVASAPVSTAFQFNSQPFAAMSGGDTGVRSVQSYSIATGTTGTVAAALVKPLLTLPLAAANTQTIMDTLFQMPSLPQIQDDACLVWMVQIGGSMTTAQTISGHVEMAYG